MAQGGADERMNQNASNMQNKIKNSEAVGNNNHILVENKLNPNNSSVLSEHEQANEYLFDIANIPVMLVDDFVVNVSERNLENYSYVPLEPLKLNETTGETPDNTSFTIQQPMLQNKLVDYSSSSESENHEKEPSRKGKKLKRFDSDYSFYEEKDSDWGFSGSDIEETTDITTDIVGNTGLKKTKKEVRKKTKKTEKVLGAGKSVQDNPCKNKRCQNGCAGKFTDQERHDIFEYYWGLGSYSKQRDWLLSCIKEKEVKRRRTNINLSTCRRNRSFSYVIKWNEQEIEVCQQFILKTLCISQMTLRYTKENAGTGIFAKVDQRGKHNPPHKTTTEDKNRVHEFIKKLPAVSSHYCRSSTTRKYLPSELRNVSFLYRIFAREQLEFYKIKTKVSLKVFRQIFINDFNIGFHLPKKDKCTLCESRKEVDNKFSQADELQYQNHIKDKDECKTQFLADQQIAKEDNSFVCASFDLQKVLNTPHGDNMLLYYSRKYAFYNETVYENGTRNAYCYLWGETDGNRGTNEICTVLYKYLQEVDDRKNVRTVALYCDSCTGQNKNKAMLIMLHTFLKKSINICHIKLTFLLPGHTYMPVDAVHATIERFIRKRIVWAPSEWPTLIANARVNPEPFRVISMKYSDFLSWKAVSESFLPNNNTKFEDGTKFQISQVRIVFLDKEDKMKMKYSYSDTAKICILPMSCGATKGLLTVSYRLFQTSFFIISGRRSKNSQKKLEQIYKHPLEISLPKFKNLMELCNKHVIPNKFFNEYEQFKGEAEVPDILPETDDEEQDSI